MSLDDLLSVFSSPIDEELVKVGGRRAIEAQRHPFQLMMLRIARNKPFGGWMIHSRSKMQKSRLGEVSV
jgi:hypothetical protein